MNKIHQEAIIHYVEKKILRSILYPLRLRPVKKNRILLINDLARKYAGNPKAVAEKLEELYPGKFDIYYAVADPNAEQQYEKPNLKFVKYQSFRYFVTALTSKVLLTNSGGISFIPLKHKQIVINTHHGGGAYKRIGRYMYEDTKVFRKDLKLAGDQTTKFLSTCKKFSTIVSDSMCIDKNKFWEIGMPRNDQLLNINNQKRNEIRAAIGLNDGEQLVLYAPTYRKKNDDHFTGSVAINYGIDCERVCKAFEKRFGGKWKFGYRLHPQIADKESVIPNTAINLSYYEDMQDLLVAADAMINDFSSSMWDFMLTGKASFLFATDMEHYIKNTQVETPVSEWPFPRSTNNDELENSILSFDMAKYQKDCRRHYDDLGGCESGKASELVSKYINAVCFSSKK